MSNPYPEYKRNTITAPATVESVSTMQAEINRLQHNNLVLMDALWKACGDDEEMVNGYIESQGELK